VIGAPGEPLAGLATPEPLEAAARSRCYRLFCVALDYPDTELCEAIRAGEVAEALRGALAAVAPELTATVAWDALREAGGPDELAVEFTRLFDVGGAGPPCPLHGGLYGGARMKAMEEAVRFYHHFGLQLDEARRELPDHLQTQLEFLHYLSYREAEALVGGEDAGPYQRALRDFVARHPGRWVPRLHETLARQQPLPYFRALVGLLARFLEHEQRHLLAVAGPPPAGSEPRPPRA
jgi:DMSO reductase family type II enzyme chaperone